MNFGYNIIAVDFDGTLCADEWPEIGVPHDSLIDYLKARREKGDKIILWTCRVGECLSEAVEWCAERGLVFDAVNENLPEVIECCGGDSRKIYADEYIDDKMVDQFGYRWGKYKYDNPARYMFDPSFAINNNGDIRMTEISLIAARDGVNRNGTSLKKLCNDFEIPPISIDLGADCKED